ncbi:RipA family octameric membrane protein [Chitinophaga silvisoli]|uniref:Uncharacterized protein n=1 Tax=Chitinophaga silvisoli TaxID=2291814 RepID=A0A3E1P9M6_9BACT|nr:hypothetical protein [Chitinophaga silvisoli]RFM36871.1 hypothetical protein DXN04_05065 [Chitinophaga silvisoli]
MKPDCLFLLLFLLPALFIFFWIAGIFRKRDTNNNQVLPIKEIKTETEYFDLFKESKLEDILKEVYNARRFEIDMYWKRTNYYWTMLVAVFAGYFVAFSNLNSSNEQGLKVVFFLNCFGIIFSTSWYLVNRGSKYWQMNWEKHAEILEGKVYGHLYKTNVSQGYYFKFKKFTNLTSPYPYSVTKINQVLNFFVIIMWLSLLYYTATNYLVIGVESFGSFYSIVGYVTILAVAALVLLTLTGKESIFSKSQDETHLLFTRRGITKDSSV